MAGGLSDTQRVNPLSLLRECTVAGKKVSYLDEYLELDGVRVHRKTTCCLRQSPMEPELDIGSVWWMFHQVSDAKDGSYTLAAAKKRGFQYIGVAIRGDLIDYLVGHAENMPGIGKRKRPLDDALVAARPKQLAKSTGSKPELPRPSSRGAASSSVYASAPGSEHAREESEQTTELSYSDVLARVRPVKDLDVLVRCPGRKVPNADLILKIAQDEVANWNQSRKVVANSGRLANGKVPFILELEELCERIRLEQKEQRAFPIILVPCNKNAPVNMANAKQLLDFGAYSLTPEDKQRAFESNRDDHTLIERCIEGKVWTFEVRDTVKNFTKHQWERVVAVVADGTEWQFKGWPFASLVDLFTTMKGIYFNALGVAPPVHVTQWAVHMLPLAPLEFQHRFLAVRDAFWNEVETFLLSYRMRKFANHSVIGETGADPSRKVAPIL